MFKPDHLHAALLAHYDAEAGMIRHPLVHTFAFPGTEQRLNRQLLQKDKACMDALVENNYDRYVFLHERPHRLDAFVRILNRMGERERADLIRAVWVDTEFPHTNHDTWVTLWRLVGKGRGMTLEAHAMLTKLLAEGEPVMVYRGGDHEEGLSWTLDRKVAEFFARRWGETGKVFKQEISPSDITALIFDRGESEVILLPPQYR